MSVFNFDLSVHTQNVCYRIYLFIRIVDLSQYIWAGTQVVYNIEFNHHRRCGVFCPHKLSSRHVFAFFGQSLSYSLSIDRIAKKRLYIIN
jgi:hypothetical protein